MKKLAAGVTIVVVVLLILAFVVYLRITEKNNERSVLIAYTEPREANGTYNYSVSLMDSPPYLQTFRVDHNYSLTSIELFLIQLNRTTGLEVDLASFDPADAMNTSRIDSIAIFIITNTSFQLGVPEWITITDSATSIPLVKDTSYKLTVKPHPASDNDAMRWIVAGDTYAGGNLYYFSEHSHIQGPLDMGTDAVFQLWGDVK